MNLHASDRKAIAGLGIIAMVGHLVLAALCPGMGAVAGESIGADGTAYVIICGPAGNERVALADYLAGARSGEPVKTGAPTYCAHCAVGDVTALVALVSMLLALGWPSYGQKPSVQHAHRHIRRGFAARAPPRAAA